MSYLSRSYIVKTDLHHDDDDDPPGGLGLGGAETEDTLVVVGALRLSVLLSTLVVVRAL